MDFTKVNLTLDVKTVIMTVTFCAGLAGAWADVKSDARNLQTVTDSRYEEFQRSVIQGVLERQELKNQIMNMNANVREDIRDLRSRIDRRNGNERREERVFIAPKQTKEVAGK